MKKTIGLIRVVAIVMVLTIAFSKASLRNLRWKRPIERNKMNEKTKGLSIMAVISILAIAFARRLKED